MEKCPQSPQTERNEQTTAATATLPTIVTLTNKENVDFHKNLQTIDKAEKSISLNSSIHPYIRRKRILTANALSNFNEKNFKLLEMLKKPSTNINYPRLEMKSIYANDDNQSRPFVNKNFVDIWKTATEASPHSIENSNSNFPPQPPSSPSPPLLQQILKQFPRTIVSTASPLPDRNHPITTNTIPQSLYEPLTFSLANRFSANDDYYQSMRERLFRYSASMRRPGQSTANGNIGTTALNSENDTFNAENETRNDADGNVNWYGEYGNGSVGATGNHGYKDISGLNSRNIRNRHYHYSPIAPDPFVQIMLSHYGKYFSRPQFWGLSGYGLYSFAAGNDLHNNLPNSRYKVQEDLD